MGDSILQKWVTTDFLSHRLKKNTGQVEQYYVKNSHEAIIDKETWEAVQQEFDRREAFCKEHNLKTYAYRADKNPLVNKIVCPHCGQTFGRRAWKDRGVIYWTCKSDDCKLKVKEQVLYKAIEVAWNYIVQNRDRYLPTWNKMINGADPLLKIRAKHMMETTLEGKIDKCIPELIQLVLEKIVIHDEKHFTVFFLEGTEKEILV